MRFFSVLLGWGLVSALHAQGLPPEVDAALARAKIPRDAVSVLVMEAERDSKAMPRVSHRSTTPMNPASVMKLVTTYAALDLLGPAYTWSTPSRTAPSTNTGVLQG